MKRIAILVAFAAAAFAAPAGAQNIYTGGPSGSYFKDFCPPLAAELGLAYYTGAKCVNSAGTVENVNKVLADIEHAATSPDPTGIGIGQGDVVALLATENPAVNEKLKIVRDDIAKECIFVISNNPRLVSIDDLSKFASRIPFVLPPQGSGSAATFSLLRHNDPDGLGRAKDGPGGNITYAGSVNEMVETVLKSPNMVGLFVQLPDPNNGVFKNIAERHGRFISVINRKLLDIKVGDKPVYVPVRTEVQGVSVAEPKGGPLTTTCTSTVIFTAKPEAIPDAENARKNQSDMINVIANLDRTKLLPATPPGSTGEKTWAWIKAKANVVTQASLDAIEKATAEARKNLPQ